MSYSDDAINKIMREYDYDRTIARSERDKRVQSVHEKFPEIAQIEREINSAGLENMGNIIRNPEKSRQLNEEFEKKLASLKKRREQLLLENNVPADYDEVKYKCEKCLDTGYIDTKKCPCFINKIIKIHHKMSNMENNLHDFSEFSFDYYSDRIIPSLNISEKENMRQIYDTAVKFCEKDDVKSMLFYGGCGVGKTFLSSCVAKRMMDEGKTVVYVTAVNLFSEYEDYKFGRRKDLDFEKTMEMIGDADLLIIDDMGVEVPTPLSKQFLFDIVDKRIGLKKKMIISTNMTIKGLIKLYTERIESRLFESFNILRFEAEDIRKTKLKEKQQGGLS